MSSAFPQSIIFDFDYTLADSSFGVIECVNYGLKRLGLPPAPHDDIRRTIGLSLRETLRTLAGDENAIHGDEFLRLFKERADEVMADATHIYDFVPRIVEALQRRRITLGIVSSKTRRRIEAVLHRDGLDGCFTVIVGGEDVPNLKPDPTGLLWAVERLGRSKQECLYVGDSITDAQTAQRSRVPFAAVLSGTTKRQAFQPYTPYLTLHSAAHLPSALRDDNII